jgi:hypothetical protein
MIRPGVTPVVSAITARGGCHSVTGSAPGMLECILSFHLVLYAAAQSDCRLRQCTYSAQLAVRQALLECIPALFSSLVSASWQRSRCHNASSLRSCSTQVARPAAVRPAVVVVHGCCQASLIVQAALVVCGALQQAPYVKSKKVLHADGLWLSCVSVRPRARLCHGQWFAGI